MIKGIISPFLGKYLVGMFVIVCGFAQFVACGTQLYRVSVKDDHDHAIVAKSNPDANNPKAASYGIHALSGWEKIPIPFRFGADLSYDQKLQLIAAIKTWEWAVGRNLFTYEGIHEDTTGDSFDDLYSSLNDTINGHYGDRNWKKTAKPEQVLATTIWKNSGQEAQINRADIRFNEEFYVIGDSLVLASEDDKPVVDMQSLALHELGHLLGLSHVDESVDELSVMNPTLFVGEGLTYRYLSRGDIERIQMIYGCRNTSCDIDVLLEEARDNEFSGRLTLAAEAWISKETP